MDLGISKPVPSSHTKCKTLKTDILNYEPISQVTDREGENEKTNKLILSFLEIPFSSNGQKSKLI